MSSRVLINANLPLLNRGMKLNKSTAAAMLRQLNEDFTDHMNDVFKTQGGATASGAWKPNQGHYAAFKKRANPRAKVLIGVKSSGSRTLGKGESPRRGSGVTMGGSLFTFGINGLLRDSLKLKRHKNHIASATITNPRSGDRVFRLGTNVPYAVDHQTGPADSSYVARPFIDLPAKVKDRLIRNAADIYIKRQIDPLIKALRNAALVPVAGVLGGTKTPAQARSALSSLRRL